MNFPKHRWNNPKLCIESTIFVCGCGAPLDRYSFQLASTSEKTWLKCQDSHCGVHLTLILETDYQKQKDASVVGIV